MIYNTAKESITIPAYGRLVQKYIAHAKTIENPQYRQAFVERVARLMMHLAQSSNIRPEDMEIKVWTHIFVIADFDLDVQAPVPVPSRQELVRRKPERVAYPSNITKYRFYGSNIRTLIAKAIATTDPEVKAGLINNIAAFMKMNYLMWNKETVEDSTIKADLLELSNGLLSLDENTDIEKLTNVRLRTQTPTTTNYRQYKRFNKQNNNRQQYGSDNRNSFGNDRNNNRQQNNRNNNDNNRRRRY